MKLLTALVVLLCIAGLSHALSFKVPPKTEDCFYQDILKGTDVAFHFQVTGGGALDIDCLVTGPDGDMLYSASREREGKYFFVTHIKGTYTFCFSNKMSAVTTKTVNMILSVGKERTEEEIVLSIVSGREARKKNEDDDTIPLISPLQSSVMQLADGLHSVQSEEKYNRVRERVHRDTTESTNSRILWFSVLENICLIGVSAWQVYILRRFFEVKRAI